MRGAEPPHHRCLQAPKLERRAAVLTRVPVVRPVLDGPPQLMVLPVLAAPGAEESAIRQPAARGQQPGGLPRANRWWTPAEL